MSKMIFIKPLIQGDGVIEEVYSVREGNVKAVCILNPESKEGKTKVVK